MEGLQGMFWCLIWILTDVRDENIQRDANARSGIRRYRARGIYKKEMKKRGRRKHRRNEAD